MTNNGSLLLINVGSGNGSTIRELAETIAEIVDYRGNIVFDTSKPDGMRMKVLNIDKVNRLGRKPQMSLGDGIKRTYKQYVFSGEVGNDKGRSEDIKEYGRN